MTVKLGILMDPIESIHVKKDTSFAMMLAAQNRSWEINYFTDQNIFWQEGNLFAHVNLLNVFDNEKKWFEIKSQKTIDLTTLDVILIRKDPPFDSQYLYATQLLEHAENKGVLVVNKPQGLRDVNEKLFTTWFPQCLPPTLITSDAQQIKNFIDTHHDIILKPLFGMGGFSIFRVKEHDPNRNVIVETLTQFGKQWIVAQKYIPEIIDGDKRILLIDGKPFPHALARIAQAGETRANLAVGGKGIGVDLTKRDYWLCEQVAPVLISKGLRFVGLDVIGDFITEINVTSPTCVRELDRIYQTNIADQFLEVLWHSLCTLDKCKIKKT